jgi:hypothetical protein
MKKLRQGKYKVKNWSEYNKSLKNRGDITFWLSDDGLTNWLEQDLVIKPRGRQIKYSKIALQTIYTFRQIFNLRLRQAEGFTRSLLKIMGVNLPVPDYTTVSRRIRKLSIDLVYSKLSGNINVILDSTGIKVLGEKEWINYKHGTRQRKIWRKLHIGVTDDGSIIAGEITTLRDSDIATVPKLLNQIPNDIDRIVGDGAYYKKRMLNYMRQYQNTRNAKFIGPPIGSKKSYGNRLKVEETFSRYKRIIGNKFKSLNFLGQQYEAKLSLLILNKMMAIGMPKTVHIA